VGQAVERYERALAIRPVSAEVHANLATALGQLSRHREAAMHAAIARAIEAEQK
jgi:Tfp pilus assembly protein PilF